VRSRGIAGKTRRRIAAEELADLVAVEAKMKNSTWSAVRVKIGQQCVVQAGRVRRTAHGSRQGTALLAAV
jgi:hypothetical protein